MEGLTTRRAIGWGAVALGLVTIVAMEAHGAAWSTQRGAHARSLPHDVIVGGVIVGAVIAFGMFLIALATTRATESAAQRRKRWTNALAFIGMLVLIIAVRLLLPAFHSSHQHSAVPPPSTIAGAGGGAGTDGHGSGNGTASWWPLMIVGLAMAAGVAAANGRRIASRVAADGPEDDAAIGLLDASLDDLRTEPDPRKAVVAAYARMERGLAARGFARVASETPTEYLSRALASQQSGSSRAHGVAIGIGPLSELTALAERARFSEATIDETMRAEAITALEALRRELRAGSGANLDRAV